MPYLAALVGLVALGGAIYLDQQNQVRFAGIAAELSSLRVAVDAAVRPPPVPAQMTAPKTNLDLEGLAALQKRVASLEEKALAPPEPVTVTGSIPPASETAAMADVAAADSADLAPPAPLEPGAIPTGTTTEAASVGTTKLADGPTKDCIPIGTRFLVTPGDSYAICRTTETVRVKDVSLEGVLLTSGKMLVAGETVALKFGKCALNVLTADDGFADMKVTCS